MPELSIDRRTLLIGGGVGVGLLVGWAVWPRRYAPNLNAAPGENIFNAFVKISDDGHVTVIVPQAEMGQGVTTALPQILADELGADWRTIAVEPSPINPLYANDFLMMEAAGHLPGPLRGPGRWVAREVAIRTTMMVTGGSTSIRGFEQRYREAGATARALLCKAAGKRWDADWDACDTEDGFVVRGKDRIRFAEVAADAAALAPPDDIPLRPLRIGKIYGESVPRIDLPAKVDGTARFAGDVRLSELVYASVRHGPFGSGALEHIDKAAADKIIGLVGVVENPRWVAAVATNWWAANRAVDALAPKFASNGPLPDDASINAALTAALAAGGGKRYVDEGDPDAQLRGLDVFAAEYRVPLAVHSPMEPLTATAQITGDRLEVWMPTQGPAIARAAVSRATGIAEEAITIYPMLVGGGFGRKISPDAAVIAAIIAIRMKRPVQVTWSRAEEIMHDDFRPPAIGRLQARLGDGGRPLAWSTTIAAPSAMADLFSRLMPVGGGDPDGPEVAAVMGGRTPYTIPAGPGAHCVAEDRGAARHVAFGCAQLFGLLRRILRRRAVAPRRGRAALVPDADAGFGAAARALPDDGRLARQLAGRRREQRSGARCAQLLRFAHCDDRRGAFRRSRQGQGRADRRGGRLRPDRPSRYRPAADRGRDRVGPFRRTRRRDQHSQGGGDRQ